MALRVVVLGNSFGSAVQVPALRVAGGCEVVGLGGADPAKLARTAAELGIPHASVDLRELLALDPDLVIVTTPVHLHRSMVLDVLEGTRAAVLCEKPFALDAGEAEELVRRAEGRQAWIDHQLRWTPPRREVRRRIASGELGRVRHVEMDFTFDSPGWAARPWRWWYDAERGGGILGALGSHMIDLLRSELGEVEAVRAQLDVLVPERRDADGTLHAVTADEAANVGLRFASGTRADLVMSLAIEHARGFYTRYDAEAGTLVLAGEERLAFAPTEARELADVTPSPGLPNAAELGMPDRGPFSRALPAYLRDLLGAVRDRSELPGAATFADGLAVQRVLDAARRSSASGSGWVEVEG